MHEGIETRWNTDLQMVGDNDPGGGSLERNRRKAVVRASQREVVKDILGMFYERRAVG